MALLHGSERRHAALTDHHRRSRRSRLVGHGLRAFPYERTRQALHRRTRASGGTEAASGEPVRRLCRSARRSPERTARVRGRENARYQASAQPTSLDRATKHPNYRRVMLRRCGAIVAMLVVLGGFSAAPYTHAHHDIASVSDEHHPHGATLVHTHASPHSQHDADNSTPLPAGQEDQDDDQISSVPTFVSQQPPSADAPAVVLVVLGERHVQPARTWIAANRPQPKAHGPPIGSPLGLRAPPALPT